MALTHIMTEDANGFYLTSAANPTEIGLNLVKKKRKKVRLFFLEFQSWRTVLPSPVMLLIMDGGTSTNT